MLRSIRPIVWVVVAVVVILAAWLILRDGNNEAEKITKNDPRLDVIVDRNKPPKDGKVWKRLSKEDQDLWLEFEKFSPNNSYNPISDELRNLTKDQQDKKLKNLWEINQIKAKLNTRKELSPEERAQFNQFLADDYDDQIDLLKFTLDRDPKLTSEQRDLMKQKIKELEEAKKNIR